MLAILKRTLIDANEYFLPTAIPLNVCIPLYEILLVSNPKMYVNKYMYPK
jgi:hypothetical protein